jgi:uncharacterized protein YjfI (DUF2170 family)
MNYVRHPVIENLWHDFLETKQPTVEESLITVIENKENALARYMEEFI